MKKSIGRFVRRVLAALCAVAMLATMNYQTAEAAPHRHSWSKFGPCTATCKDDGVQYYYCFGCGDVKTEPVKASPEYHKWVTVWNRQEPTCTEVGHTKGRYCSVCDKTEQGCQEIPPLGHHEITIPGYPATCTTDGLTDGVYCDRCDKTLVEQKTIPANGSHTWSEWETETAPTCTSGGKEVCECTVCHTKDHRDTNPLGHTWGEWTTSKDATCTEKGQEVRECSVCHEKEYRDTDPKGHKPITDPGYPATCVDDGLTDGSHCDVCKTIIVAQQTIPATGIHTWGEWTTSKDATCTEKGQEVRECMVCHEKEYRDTNALGHDYQPGTVVDPTCIDEGYTIYECTHCHDQEKRDFTDPTGHTWGEWTTSKDATCTEKGQETRECSACHKKEYRDIEPLGHDYQPGTVVDPTCIDEGYTIYECTHCHDQEKRDITNPTGHTWGEWTTSKDATCTEKGQEVRECSACHKKEYRDTDALGHDYQSKHVDATCTENGYTHNYCSRCDWYDDEYDDPSTCHGHNFDFNGEYEVKTPSTCYSAGVGIFSCTYGCGETCEHELPLEEHKFTSQTFEPTCTKLGYTKYTCTNDGCDFWYCDDYVDELGHDYKSTHVDATCTENGYTHNYCSRCDWYLDEFDDPSTCHGHNFDFNGEYEVKTPSTCNSTGVGIFSCTYGCGQTCEHDLPMIEHKFTSQTFDPTCNEMGYTKYTCTNEGCTYSYCDDYIDPLGHDYQSTHVDATCTENGYTHKYCSRCDWYIDEFDDPSTCHGHNFDFNGEYEVKVPSTCHSAGVGIFSCTYGCGQTCEHDLPLEEHKYTSQTFKPTCTEMGYTKYTCTNEGCNFWYCDDYVKELGHDLYIDSTKEPTCTEIGYNHYQCSRCEFGYFDQENPIPALGHKSGDYYVSIKASNYGNGEKTCDCVREGCGAKGLDYITIPQANLSIDNTKVIYNGLNRTIKAPDHPNGVVPTLVITKNNEVVTGAKDAGIYKFTYTYPETDEYESIEIFAYLTIDKYVFNDKDKSEIEKLLENYAVVCKKEYDHLNTIPLLANGFSMWHIVSLDGNSENVLLDYNATFNDYKVGEKIVNFKMFNDDKISSNFDVSKVKNLSLKMGEITPVSVTVDDAFYVDLPGGVIDDYDEIGKAIESTDVGKYVSLSSLELTSNQIYAIINDFTTFHYSVVDYSEYQGVRNNFIVSAFTEYEKEDKASIKVGIVEEDTQEVVATVTFNGTIVRHELCYQGHTWGEWTTSKDATCTEKGQEVRECSACHKKEYRDTNALGHDYKPGTVVDPTCIEEGYTIYECTHCHDQEKRDFTDPTGHTWGEWYHNNEYKAPTCTEDGVKRHDCQHCDAFETETVKATGHDYKPGTVVDPTCIEEGYTIYECTNCHDQEKRDFTDPTGHTWGEWYHNNEYKAPTCTEDGVKRHDCQHCDAFETETVKATGHIYNGYVTEPTCTKQGYTTYICDICKDEYIDDYVDPTGHDYSIKATVEPTCTEGGYTTYTCIHEDDSYIDDYTKPLGHDWSEWKVTKNATCTANGEETRTCSRCPETETRPIPATGHHYGDIVIENRVEPTREAEGGYDEVHYCACGAREVVRHVVLPKLDPLPQTGGANVSVVIPVCGGAILILGGILVLIFIKKRKQS